MESAPTLSSELWLKFQLNKMHEIEKKIVHSIKIWKKYVFIIKNIYYKLQ